MKTLIALAALAAFVPATLAQTGPWTDGEMIVRSFTQPAQEQAFFRINPDNGDGEELIAGFSFWGWSGGYTFDRHRNAVVANLSFPPGTSYLHEISSGGVATPIPGFDFARLRAMASAGDGRLFFQEVPPTPSLKGTIQWLDAQDAVHTLLDATGTAPLELSVEHMIWHAASNALIATTSSGAPGSCDPARPTVYRIPLSADGTRVDGGVSCSGFGTAHIRAVGLDVLPGGEVLMTLANSSGITDVNKLLPVNPLTLAIGGTLAGVQPALLHGGHYNERISRFVVLDNGTGNVLRTYAPTEVGNGTVLATDVPLLNGMGFSPVDTLVEVREPSEGCTGAFQKFGAGLWGSAGGFTPVLGGSGCPAIGEVFGLHLDLVAAHASGLLFVGLAQAALPFKGGTLHVAPVLVSVPVTVGETSWMPTIGSLDLPAVITHPALAGMSLYLQAAFADSWAVQGVSLTNGLQLTVGN